MIWVWSYYNTRCPKFSRSRRVGIVFANDDVHSAHCAVRFTLPKRL